MELSFLRSEKAAHTARNEKQQSRSTLVAAQWRRRHRLNTSIVLAAGHGLLGLPGRAFTLSPPSLPSLSPSLVSILTSVDVKQNVYVLRNKTPFDTRYTKCAWNGGGGGGGLGGGGGYAPLGGTIFEDIPLVEFMCLVFTRVPGESYRRRLGSLLLCPCDDFRALINSLVCYYLWRSDRLKSPDEGCPL